jgi:dimethylamine/trimethylamine dehydrogenase
VHPSADLLRQDFPAHGRAMDRSELCDIRRWHRNGVRTAIEAGFDLVYVYVGHSLTILPDFLSPRINRRTDEYGGSLENRTRLLRETLDEVINQANGRCAVAIRLCVDEQQEPEAINAEDGRAVVEMLAEVPDLWDVNVGGFNDMPGSRFREQGWEEPGIAFVKQVTSKPVVGVGRFTSPDMMVSMIKRGVLDLIGAVGGIRKGCPGAPPMRRCWWSARAPRGSKRPGRQQPASTRLHSPRPRASSAGT